MNDEDTTWLTPVAHAKLKQELEHLTTEGRLEMETRIAEAREHGDLRENAEYDTAKNDQGLMEARIRRLKYLLENSEVREVEDTGVVEVGSVVSVRDADGDETDFLVAHSENRITGMPLVSPESPLGTALLGAGPGSAVSYEAPGGTLSYTVLAIRPYEA